VTSWSGVDGGGRLRLVNLSALEREASWALRRVDLEGRVLAAWDGTGSVAPGDVVSVDLPERVARPADPVRAGVVLDCGAAVVTVEARALARDLLLQADRLSPEARCDEGLVTLLPGESHRWEVAGLRHPVTVADLRPPVLMCFGRLGQRSGGLPGEPGGCVAMGAP
jgi:beta-mannosidase